MTNKILVTLFVPVIEENYEVWIPIHKTIGDIIILLSKSVRELSGGIYEPKEFPALYNQITTERYDVNLMVYETSIRNCTELMLI